MKSDMKQSRADPCLFYHKDGDLFLEIHVDDVLCIETQEKIDSVVAKLKESLDVKVEEEL